VLVLLHLVCCTSNLVSPATDHEGDSVHRVVEVVASRASGTTGVDEGWVVRNDPLRRGSLPEDGVRSSGMADCEIRLLREPVVEVPSRIGDSIASLL
jgi:hypothetical protein